jgi:starch synthase
VPIVSRVGGLADTVVDANDAAVGAGVATGVQFSPVTQGVLEQALWRASRLFTDNKAWDAMQRAGMSADVSWDRSAQRYAGLYKAVAT